MPVVHPDANAFVAGILAEPTDRLRRLVFADWLEESGDEANTAWAGYIRTQAEWETTADDDPRTAELKKMATDFAEGIRIRLTLPARAIQSRFLHLHRLLPAEKVTVRLNGEEIPRTVLSFIPENMARLYRVLPVAFRRNHLVLVSSVAHDKAVQIDLENFLSVTLVVFFADEDEICDAIERHDWQTQPLDTLIEWYDSLASEWRE
jgi:uncharacterized protein (TIGR02996 family)